jgi:hypothetical protein
MAYLPDGERPVTIIARSRKPRAASQARRGVRPDLARESVRERWRQ